jgi:serine/threonine protein phosphatase PrpC
VPKVNQDRYLVLEDFIRWENETMSLHIVADGHGSHGHFISDKIVTAFPSLLKSLLEDSLNISSRQTNLH